MMQMMIVMMMMVISHIGNSEEIDVLSTEETTCSNDAEQVQVLVRELEATQARLAELEKRSSTSIEFDLEWMKKSANEGILSMSKFVSNPWEGGPLIFEKTKVVVDTLNSTRSGIVSLLRSSDVMSQVEVEFIVDTMIYFVILLVGITISQKILTCCSSSSLSEKRRKKKRSRRRRK